MKKLLAVALALLLALSCTLALAETAGIPGFQGMTVESDFDVDRDVLMNALTQFGLDDSVAGIADTVAAIIDECGEKVVLAPDGLQYELLLKGTSLLNLVAQISETGLTASTSLLPSYAFTATQEEIGKALESMTSGQSGINLEQLDTEALTQAITGHLNTFIASCSTAIAPGAPERGDFVLDGNSFNIKIPLNVNLSVFVDAANTLITDLANDETVKSAVETLQGMGVDISLPDSIEVESVDPASLPEVAVDVYTVIDEAGNQGDVTDVVFSVTLPGTEEPATTGDVLIQGRKVRVIAQFLSAGLNFGCVVEPTDNGGSARFDFDYEDKYVGFAAVCDSQDTGTIVDGYVYLMDEENPVFTSHSTITRGGALTLSPEGEGKTVVNIFDLMGENSEDAIGGIAMDLMLNGLGSLLSTATSLMPDEIGAITGMLMGGGSQPAA